MPSTINRIVDGFSFPTIFPIIRTPTYNSIAKVSLKLNSNVSSFQSNPGCGTLVVLQLAVSSTVYTTLSDSAFIVTVNHGLEDDIPDASTGPQTAELCYKHDIATALFNEYDCTDKYFLQILLSNVDQMFIRVLCHKYMRYGTTSTLSILDHLYAT